MIVSPTLRPFPTLSWLLIGWLLAHYHAFTTTHAWVQLSPHTLARTHSSPIHSLAASTNNDNNDNSMNDNTDAEQWQRQARELREQIRKLEQDVSTSRQQQQQQQLKANDENNNQETASSREEENSVSLRNQQILVVGANGRLGSMVCRYLLRQFPKTKVVALVHGVSTTSSTARGYGRLSYEVGAEDGVGTVAPVWATTSSEETQQERPRASFQFDPNTMSDYNLHNLRVVECELLDEQQCRTILSAYNNIGAVVWCATDFTANRPRAIASLNVAFLLRALSRPSKGRVEVEGLQNMLRAWRSAQSESSDKRSSQTPQFVLVSTALGAFDDVATPSGTFYQIKQQGERLLLREFPSIPSTVLQLGRFDDAVEENLPVQAKIVSHPNDLHETNNNTMDTKRGQRPRINQRDAAQAVVEALLKPAWIGQTVQLWTKES